VIPEAQTRTARVEDVSQLSRALGEAFYDDPVFGWLMPDPARRPARLRRFFELELRTVGLPRGSVWTTDALDGAAITTPPGMWWLPMTEAIRNVAGFTRAFGRRLPHATALLQLMEHRHIREPHHYFAYIGVAPRSQGQGLGTRLMRPVLEDCDVAGLPAYLEATSERNARLYERLGFTLLDTLTLGSSPPLLLMRRDPVQATRPA
jgi:GNAT superfamily N-acetyltransferase